MTKEAASFNVAAIEFEENLVIDIQFFIKDAMDAKGLSKSDLAKLLGVSKSRLSHIFAPNANLTVRTLAKIAFALGIDIAFVEKTKRILRENDTGSAWSDTPLMIEAARQQVRVSKASSWATNDNWFWQREKFASDEVDVESLANFAEAA